MAKVNLIGVEPMDFPTSDGKQIKGIKLHMSYADDRVMGLKSDGKFITDDACRNLGITLETLSPLIGECVELETNLKGKITAVHLA